MLTGRVPFDDASAMSVALKHISDPPPPPSELNPNVPPEVEQVLLKALDKEVNARYGSAKEFVNALETAFDMLEESNIAPPPEIPDERLAPSNPAKPIPDAKAASDEDAPTLHDTSSKTRKKSETTATVADKPTSAVPPGQGDEDGDDDNPSWALWMSGGFVLIMIILGASFVLFGEFDINTAATATAIAEATEEIEQATAEAQTQVALAEITEDAMTETAQAEASAEAAQIAATETARAEEEDAATSTPEPTETPEPTTTASNTPTDAATDTPQPDDTPTATATSTPRPTQPRDTPTPLLFIDEDAADDTAQILLRYDGRMMVISNRSNTDTFDISDLEFELFEPDEDTNSTGGLSGSDEFTIDDNRSLANPSTRFNPERCLQILDSNQFRSPPAFNPLADDICGGTPFWVTTTDSFWTSNAMDEAYFEVRLGPVDVLTRCPVNVPQTRSEQRCVVNLDVLP
jgi:hypothetical protein